MSLPLGSNPMVYGPPFENAEMIRLENIPARLHGFHNDPLAVTYGLNTPFIRYHQLPHSNFIQ